MIPRVLQLQFFRNRFPPYSDTKLKMIKLLVAKQPILGLFRNKYLIYTLMFGLGVLATIGVNTLLKVKK